MGHLCIVNQDTIKEMLETGHLSTRGTLGEYPIKTISDLFSDVLATRPGDLVFPWIVKGKDTPNIGFQFVFRVSGKPFYVNGEEFPIKVPMKKKYRKFETPLKESEALNLFGQKLLWNAIGKKSLGRGRSLTHQTFLEDELLLSLMEGKNGRKSSLIDLKRKDYKEKKAISISPLTIHSEINQEGKNHEDLFGENITELRIDQIPWITNSGLFRYEKTFEAWLMENIDKPQCKDLWDILAPKRTKIEWFGNYLPFGVAGSNIDAVVLIKENGQIKIFVIELKRDPISQHSFEKVAAQVIEYAEFIKSAFASFQFHEEFSVTPVILTGFSPKTHSREKILFSRDVQWIGYQIMNGKVSFHDHF